MKKYIALIAIALLALVSCQEFEPVVTDKYPAPADYKFYTDDEIGTTNIISIAQLASFYTPEKPFQMPGDKYGLQGKYIKGRVSTTDQPGNFYKSLFIQDETGGIELKIGKNGLYNDYLPGQVVYVELEGLTLGMYGYKTGDYGGMGMVQIGYADPTGEYETSYMEVTMIVNTHILRGDPSDIQPVKPAVISESDLPNPATATQAKNKYVGSLVTLKGLVYKKEIFALLYLDPSLDKKSYTNRVFLSDSNGIVGGDKTHGVTTWAMSEPKMKEYLLAGLWDKCNIGSGKDFVTDSQGNKIELGSMKGDGSYPNVSKDAYSVSQYFKMGNTDIQIRTSGYSKFSDREIPEEVRNGSKTIDVTGVINLYQGSIQLTVNDISDIVVDGKPLE